MKFHGVETQRRRLKQIQANQFSISKCNLFRQTSFYKNNYYKENLIIEMNKWLQSNCFLVQYTITDTGQSKQFDRMWTDRWTIEQRSSIKIKITFQKYIPINWIISIYLLQNFLINFCVYPVKFPFTTPHTQHTTHTPRTHQLQIEMAAASIAN